MLLEVAGCETRQGDTGSKESWDDSGGNCLRLLAAKSPKTLIAPSRSSPMGSHTGVDLRSKSYFVHTPISLEGDLLREFQGTYIMEFVPGSPGKSQREGHEDQRIPNFSLLLLASFWLSPGLPGTPSRRVSLLPCLIKPRGARGSYASCMPACGQVHFVLCALLSHALHLSSTT